MSRQGGRGVVRGVTRLPGGRKGQWELWEKWEGEEISQVRVGEHDTLVKMLETY